MKLEAHSIHTYARLLEFRARQSGTPVKLVCSVGEKFATIMRCDRPVPFAYIVLITGESYSIPSHEHPDPRLLGNVANELAAAEACGELAALKEDLTVKLAEEVGKLN